jgi:ATP-binding cassette subfamily B protein/subfamily B ATP-binding cassette protein MsbA
MKRWWLKLLRYAAPQTRGLLGILILMHVGIGVKLLGPWPLKLIVDYVLSQEPLPANLAWIAALPGAGSAQGLLSWLAGATVLLFLARRVVASLQGYLQAGTSTRMVYNLGADLFRHLQRRSLQYHGRQRVGDLLARVTTDAGCVRELVMGVYVPLTSSLIMLVFTFLIMWRLNPLLSVTAMGMAVPLALVIKYLSGPMAERKYRERELQGEVMTLAEQVLTAMPLVQAFGRERHEEERFRGLAGQTLEANLRSTMSQEQFKISTGAFSAAATAIAMLVGGSCVLAGSLTVGGLLVLISYFNQLYSPLETLAYLASGFAAARAGSRRVLEILQSEDEAAPEAPDAKPLPAGPRGSRGHIRLDQVTFGYEPGQPVLHEVTLEALPGETVALVGHTGAGKSTVLSLIARLYDPWRGAVLFDGMDLRAVKATSLRASIAVLLQEPFLLPLTIAENIAYGRPDAKAAEIIAAAKAAQAHEFIERLPSSYATVVGERGATLSGGEKQRLAIARAFLMDAPLLLLDEPTAALDGETETALLEAMQRLVQGRTTFIIAHRFSTIRSAHRIAVLDHGLVVEVGSHSDLMARRGAYYQLRTLQLGETKSAYTR